MIKPADTKELSTGKYYYDVGLQSGDDYYYIVEPSRFVIEQRVTNWEAI